MPCFRPKQFEMLWNCTWELDKIIPPPSLAPDYLFIIDHSIVFSSYSKTDNLIPPWTCTQEKGSNTFSTNTFFKDNRSFLQCWGKGKQQRNICVSLLPIETEPLSWVTSYSSPLGDTPQIVPSTRLSQSYHTITRAPSPSASTAVLQAVPHISNG